MEEARSRRHHAVKLALTSLVAAPALTVLATAPAFADQSDQGAPSSQSASSSSDHSQGNAGTSGTYDHAQPTSTADDNTGGANGQCGDGTYCSTRNGEASGNGNQEQGSHTGEPCAGCVGKADNKNPPGQETSDPLTTFPNNGYECDRNNGIGQGNPAHTGCTSTSGSTTEVGGSAGSTSAENASDEGEADESGEESGAESAESSDETSDQQGRTIAEMPAMQPALRPAAQPAMLAAPAAAPEQQPATVAVAQPGIQPRIQPETQPATQPQAAQPAPATGTQQVPAVVLGESLTASGSTGAAATAATVPGTGVMGEQLTRTATGGTGAAAGAPQLPFTGSPAAPLGLLGAALVAFGGGLLLVARRRITQ